MNWMLASAIFTSSSVTVAPPASIADVTVVSAAHAMGPATKNTAKPMSVHRPLGLVASFWPKWNKPNPRMAATQTAPV